MSSEISEFIKAHGDGHIRQASYEAIRDNLYSFYGVVRRDGRGNLIGVSLFRDGISVTVVHKDHRGKGLSTSLIREKIELLRNHGVKFVSTVNAANTPSLRALLSCGCVITSHSVVSGKVILTVEHLTETFTPRA